MKTNNESGNVFFLILAAIAMFAALSWAFTQNSRTSSSALTADQNRMAAQEIIAYGNSLADAMQKIRLRGCNDNQYDFTNSAWTTVAGVPIHTAGQNPTAAAGCNLFTDGKVQAVVMPSNYVTSASSGTQAGHGRIIARAVPGVGSATNDLVYRLVVPKAEICMKINEILGVTNPNNDLPRYSGASATNLYTGTLTATAGWVDDNGVLTGKTAYCAYKSDDTSNWISFFQVILAR